MAFHIIDPWSPLRLLKSWKNCQTEVYILQGGSAVEDVVLETAEIMTRVLAQ
jgi:hypothetical protein